MNKATKAERYFRDTVSDASAYISEAKSTFGVDMKKLEYYDLAANALRRIAEDDKARPYSVGTKVFYLPSDGTLKDHIIEIVVHGYSESAWQGTANIGKDHRFIVCHNSYNEPHAYPLKECYATRQEATAALGGGEGG